MRKLIIAASLLLVSSILFAQNQFEGIIEYRITDPSRKDSVVYMTVYFGQGAMKIIYEERFTTEIEILDLRLGTAIIIDEKNKIFFRKDLLEAPLALNNVQPYSIDGISTTLHNLNPGPGAILFSVGMGGELVFHVAKNLFYDVPEKYKKNMEFLMVHEGKIVLGCDFEISSAMEYDEDDYDKSLPVRITGRATSVRPMKFGPGEFSIPAGYTEEKVQVFADSTRIMLDTMSLADTVVKRYEIPKSELKKVPAEKKSKNDQSSKGSKQSLVEMKEPE